MILRHRRPRVLYVSPNGIGTALVYSQVLPYLRGLMRIGIDIELVTFERGDSYLQREFPIERWRGVRARSGHALLSKIIDILAGVWLVVRISLVSRRNLLHARSYVPAAIAATVGWILRTPFVFDMRGFLPDEYVDAGVWTVHDARYRALRLAERLLLRRAKEIVVLTERAAEVLREDDRYTRAVGRTPVTVIPCAVDLSRFVPATRRSTIPTLVYSGSLGMWYLLHEMLVVYRWARAHVPGLRFLILNRSEQGAVASAVATAGLTTEDILVQAVEPEDMPRRLAEAHVGISLIRPVPSKRGSSPIKIPEYLACGLPVIVNAGIGDTDRLVARYAAGHVIADLNEDGLRRAGLAVRSLLDHNEMRANARRLAEAEYDVNTGVARYAEIYQRALLRP